MTDLSEKHYFADQPDSPPPADEGDAKKKPTNREVQEALDKEKQELEIQGRLAAIIRTISGRDDVSVTTSMTLADRLQLQRQGQDPDSTWFAAREYDPKTRKFTREVIHVPKKILERGEDVAKGKAAHEAGHTAITRFGEFIPDEVLQEPGFHLLAASAEERPTDQVVRDRYEGAGQWVDTARQDNIKDALAIKRILGKLGRNPKSMQLGSLIVHEPHETEDLPLLGVDDDVRRVYEQMRAEVEKLEGTLPAEGSTEAEIVAKAKERYKILYKKLWPKFKKAVEYDIKMQQLQQMMQKAAKQKAKRETAADDKEKQPQPEPGDDQPRDDLMDKLSSEQLDKLLESLEKAMQEMEDQEPEEQDQQPPQEGEQTSMEDLMKELAEKMEQMEEGDDQAKEEMGELMKQMLEQMQQQDTEDQEGGNPMQQMMKEMMEQMQQQQGEKQEGQLGQEGQDGEGQPQPGQDGEGQPQPGQDGEGQPQPGQEGEDQLGEQEGEGQSGRMQELMEEMRQQLQQQLEQEQKKGKGGSPPPRIDVLSKELQQELEDEFEKLPDDVKQQLRQEAQELFEQMEDELVKDMQGDLDENAAETHEEYEIRKEQEEQDEERRQEIQANQKSNAEEMKDIDRRLAALADNIGPYEEVYKELVNVDENLYRRLEEIFRPNIKKRTKLASQGAKINLPAVFRWDAERSVGHQDINQKIFERTSMPEKRDYTISILVDLSGSMTEYGKIEETFKAVVVLTEVLNRLGINFEILGFQDVVIKFKEFGEKLTDEVRQKIATMKLEAHGEAPGGNNWNNNNDDGPCLESASSRLEKESGKNKFLLVLTDGRPNGRHSTEQDLYDAVEKILHETDQMLIGVGLGGGTGHVKDYYPSSLPNIDISKLTEELGDLMEAMIITPGAFRYTGKQK